MMLVTGGPRACVCSETVRASCVACTKINKKKSEEIYSNKFNIIMIKAHAHRHRPRQQDIIGLFPLSRQRYDTMMLVIVKRIVSGRTLGGLGVGKNDISSTYV